MKFQLSLNENDCLQHQLYTASKSASIKKNRLKSWLILSFGSLLLSWLFYRSNNNVLTYYFLSISIVLLLFYPFYQRYRYKEYYRKKVQENQKNKSGLTTIITFTDDFLEIVDNTGEGKIKLSEIEEIIEIRDYFFLKLKMTNSHLIIPQSCLPDVNLARSELTALTHKLTIQFISDFNWKWR